jgi:hypothetical protein
MAAHMRRSRFNPVLALVYMTFLVAFAVVGLAAYWMLAPYEVLRVTNAHMSQSVVMQGQTTAYSDDYIKLLDIDGQATRAFVDGIVYDAGSYDSALPVQLTPKRIVRPVTIPSTLPPGRYHLQITVRYQVNPLRELVYQFYTDEFTVVANPANPDASGDTHPK